jgi:putative acetyltransferase
MVILIGGATRTGKTLMAQRLMEKYGYPYTSVDHIKMGLYRGLKDDKYNPEQDYKLLAEELWPVVKGIIMTAIENKQNLILEGCYILPYMADDFTDEYRKEIIPFFILFSDEYIKTSYPVIFDNQSVIELRDGDDLEPMGRLLELHDELRNMCIEAGADFIDIHQDYENEIKEIYAKLDNKINCD